MSLFRHRDGPAPRQNGRRPLLSQKQLRRLIASTLEASRLRTLDFERLPGRSCAFVRLGASRTSAPARRNQNSAKGAYIARIRAKERPASPVF